MICKHHETLTPKGECIYYDAEAYNAGVAQYCKYYGKLLYYLKDKGCPERPIYSDEVIAVCDER